MFADGLETLRDMPDRVKFAPFFGESKITFERDGRSDNIHEQKLEV